MADRENGRVQCFTLDGDFTRSIQPEEFGSRIFSVAYTKAKGKGYVFFYLACFIWTGVYTKAKSELMLINKMFQTPRTNFGQLVKI